MSDFIERGGERNAEEESPDVEYRLSDTPTDHSSEKSNYDIGGNYFEPLEKPKKVRTINLWYWIRLPFSFLFLAAAFWVALNFNSLTSSDNFEEWFRNWSDNTKESWEGYFGNGQLATYDGLISGKSDWVGLGFNGEPIEILESEMIPFGADGELPLTVAMLDEAYRSESCAVLVSEYFKYYELWRLSSVAEEANSKTWEAFTVHAYDSGEKLKCEFSSTPHLTPQEILSGVTDDSITN